MSRIKLAIVLGLAALVSAGPAIALTTPQRVILTGRPAIPACAVLASNGQPILAANGSIICQN